MLQLSLDQGWISVEWRKANIVLINKKGEKHLPSKYRSVSLASISCKPVRTCYTQHSHWSLWSTPHSIWRTAWSRRSCKTQCVITLKQIAKPDAPQCAALYDRSVRTLNSWVKYGHNIQTWYSSEFGLWLNSWQHRFLTQNECGLRTLTKNLQILNWTFTCYGPNPKYKYMVRFSISNNSKTSFMMKLNKVQFWIL